MSPALFPNGIPALDQWYRDREKLREVNRTRYPPNRSTMFVTPPFLGVLLNPALKPPEKIVDTAKGPIEGIKGLQYETPQELLDWHDKTKKAFFLGQTDNLAQAVTGPLHWQENYTKGPRALEVLGPWDGILTYRIPSMYEQSKYMGKGLNFNIPLRTQALHDEWEDHLAIVFGEIDDTGEKEELVNGEYQKLAGEWAKQFILSSTKMWERHEWRGIVPGQPRLFNQVFQDKLGKLRREISRASHVLNSLEWEKEYPLDRPSLAVGADGPIYRCKVRKCFCGNQPWMIRKDYQTHAFEAWWPTSHRFRLSWINMSTGKKLCIEDPTSIDYDAEQYYKSMERRKTKFRVYE